MTPDLLYPPPPRLLQWVPCPVCNMLFKDAQGRGGHLRHMRDSAHTAYRAQNGLAKPKRSRYPDSAPPVSPRVAPTPPAPPPEDEIAILDFGEPQQFSVLLEDEPEAPEALAPASPAQQLSASPPTYPGDARVPVAQAPTLGVSPPPASPSQAAASPALPPASPTQAIRLALPEAPIRYGESGEAGKAGGQGASIQGRQAEAGAPDPPPTPAQAKATNASGASPSPALPASPPASPSGAPASPVQAVRLALSEAANGYGAPGKAGEAAKPGGSTQGRRGEAGAPVLPSAPAQATRPSPAQAEAPTAPGASVDWADPKNAKAGLGVVAGALMRPHRQMHWIGRVICFGIAVAIVSWPLWELIQQLRAPNRAAEPYVIDASKLTPSPPSRKTGDPYWDHLLGYAGGKP